MAQIPTNQQASAEDFRWLHLDKYVALSTAGPQQWAQVILDRVDLSQWLDNGLHQKATAAFETLKEDPLAVIVARQLQPPHTADQKSIRLLTVGQLLHLQTALPENPPKDDQQFDQKSSGSIDDLLRARHGDDWVRYAHLRIDLHATDDQLVTDFKNWLSAWRAFTPARSSGRRSLERTLELWAKRNVVPYFDLEFQARLLGKKIPRPVFTEKLTRRISSPVPADDPPKIAPSTSQLDELRKDMPKIFAPAVGNMLLNAFDDETEPPENALS